jgi:MFS superfamily sulfate permease-like transporter
MQNSTIEQSAQDLSPTHVPQNGLAGLKHWRQDMIAGLIVALVSVPLSLGIALASGAPPICGLTSEIIAGLIFPLLGGAYATISGPAAGLSPVLYSGIYTLGHGNMEIGYRLITAIILFAGLTQLVLAYLKAAKFSYLIPRAAIQGMLTAIGIGLLVKQIPNLIGEKFHCHELISTVFEIPAHIAHTNIGVFTTALICIALLFFIPNSKINWLKKIPAHLIVVVAGILLGQIFHLHHNLLIQIPADPFKHGIVLPDFQGLFSHPALIPTIIFYVFALTFVDGTESLATIHAVDQIDPYHRKSNPTKTLSAMGISNICSSLIGGLTIIPGIIKSTTNIVAGGRTAWVNFYNALFLICFLLIAHNIISLIPVATLAAVLVHIGFKLAGPSKWQSVFKLGWIQAVIFSTTVIVTLFSDLLIGIACGILVKIVILLAYSFTSAKSLATRKENLLLELWDSFISLFKTPVLKLEFNENIAKIYFHGSLTCFNNLAIRSAIEKACSSCKNVEIIFTPDTRLVDHSTQNYLTSIAKECFETGNQVIAVKGMDKTLPVRYYASNASQKTYWL